VNLNAAVGSKLRVTRLSLAPDGKRIALQPNEPPSFLCRANRRPNTSVVAAGRTVRSQTTIDDEQQNNELWVLKFVNLAKMACQPPCSRRDQRTARLR
jgi:hypothetical protein